jgi:hypothetical protein
MLLDVTLHEYYRWTSPTKLALIASLAECHKKFAFARDVSPTCKTTHEQLCMCITSNARHSTGRRLKEAGLEGSAVDFLSVDVEGVELMVRLEPHAMSCACNLTELFCRF